VSRGDLDALSSAKDLADVDVSATTVYLRVVRVENRTVDTCRASDAVAGVVGFNNVSSLAVLAGSTKTEGAAWCKVGAVTVDRFDVVHGELVGGHVISSGDAVTVVTRLDGVRARAGSSHGRLGNKSTKGNGDDL